MPPKKKPGSSRAFKDFATKFAKDYGDGALAPIAKLAPYEVIPTGSLRLDYATGVGGLVEGRLSEWWGVDAIGKSTFCALAAVEAQRKHPDKLVGWIDMEQTLDLPLFKRLGVDVDTMFRFAPNSAEDVADALKDMVRSGEFSYVVVDSIGAMIPEAEKTKDADEAVVALQAKIVTRMVKIAAAEAPATGTHVALINQVRAAGVGKGMFKGSPTMTTGGFALKHVTTHKFRLSRTGTPEYMVTIDGEKVKVGHEVAVKVERNKVAPPGRIAEVGLFNTGTEKYGPAGVDKPSEAFGLGTLDSVGAIIRSGAYYTFPDGERIHTADKALEYLRANPDLVEVVRQRAIASLAGEVVEDAPPPALPDGMVDFSTGPLEEEA